MCKLPTAERILIKFCFAWSTPKAAGQICYELDGQILIRQFYEKNGSIVRETPIVAHLAKQFPAVINRFMIQPCTLINTHKIIYE